MATRAIIAVKRSQGWRGRYAHWDNYPERMVGVLGQLAHRDGLTQVVTTLINDNPSWSIINPDTTGYESDPLTRTETLRKGYGIVHDDMDKDSDQSWYTEATGAYSWADYVYVMEATGVTVYTVQAGDTETLERMAFYTWAEAELQAGIGV